MDFQTLQGFTNKQNNLLKKKESGQSCGAEPGRPRSGGLPGSSVTEAVRHRPIQIGRRAALLPRGATHAGEGDAVS
jgi:hypothetical protein